MTNTVVRTTTALGMTARFATVQGTWLVVCPLYHTGWYRKATGMVETIKRYDGLAACVRILTGGW